MEDIIDIIVTETTNTIEITSQSTDEVIDVNIIDNREDITLNVTPTLVEININSLTGNFGVNWGEIEGTLSNQTDLQDALNLKADLVGGKVPSSQLPSYVDDVVEVANYAALPATGETGKIYVTIDTNYIYRWTGSVYVEIKDSSAVWGAITGTLSSQTDLQSALNAKQASLSGSGIVKSTSGTISYLTDNSTNWDTAYNDKINSAEVTGTTTKTLTLTQQDGGTVTASWTDINTDAVSSVFGRTGAVVAASGDYTTTQVTEGDNLYYTNARARGAISAGTGITYNSTTGVIASSITQYTDALARAALSFTAGSGAYNSTTGVITIPTNTNQLTNGASFITLGSLSAGTGISYNNTTGVIASSITQYTDALARLALSAGTGISYNNETGVITSSITQYTDALARLALSAGTGISYNNETGVITSTITQYTNALARAAISLTTTGTSGAATYNSETGVLNIPSYVGGVTSVFGRTGAVVAASGDYYVGTTAIQASSANQALTGISGITFVAQSSDSASISTTIDGTSTFFDFNLTDDNLNDEWRWRFTPSGASVYNAMRLVPTTNSTSDLIVSGAISGSNLSGTNTGDQTLSGLGGVPTGRKLSINGTEYDLSADRSWTITAGVTGSGTATRVAFFDGTNSITSSSGFYWDNSAGRLAVGKNSADARLEVYGGTKGQIRANGGTALGGGVDLYTELTGADRRNWALHTESTDAGDFEILRSASAGASPTVRTFTLAKSGEGTLWNHFNVRNALSSGIGIYLDQTDRVSGRNWSILNGNTAVGEFSIKDETAAATRFKIATDGVATTYVSAAIGIATDATSYVRISENQIYRTGGGALYINNSGSGAIIMAGGGGNVLINTGTDAGYKLDVNGTGRFTGNLGVGTTLYGWSTLKGIDLGSNAALGSYDGYYTMLTNNTYYNGSDFKYKVNGYAGWLQLRSDDGTINLATTNSSGTAGASVTGMTSRLSFAASGAATFSSSIKSVGRIFTTSDAAYGDLVSTNGCLVFSFDATGQESYIRSYNYTTSLGKPMNFNASKYVFNEGNVGIGTTTDGGYKLDVAGQMRAFSGSPLIVSMSTTAANDAVVAARWTSGTGIEMRYNPNNALCYFDSTYQATSGQVFGDMRFRINAGGTMSTVMTIKSNNSSVGIGDNPNLKLSVFDSGATITSGNVTFATQAKGIEIVNNNSAITDNLVGLWFSTGVHKAGIASGRSNAAANWAVDLRFFTHYDTTSNLDNTYEVMRVTGNGNLLVGYTSSQGSYAIQANGSMYASAYFESSDLKLKNISKSYSSDSFGAIEYNWKDKRDEKNHWGYVAQEVQSYLPDAVIVDNNGYLSVDYNQAHTFKIAKVEDEVTLLKKRVTELEAQLNLN